MSSDLSVPPPESTSRGPQSWEKLARSLFELVLHNDAPDQAALVVASVRLFGEVSTALSRWFGPFGAEALIGRALVRAQSNSAALSAVHAVPGTASLSGISESATKYGAEATRDGVVLLIASLANGLVRLIGDDLAGTLLEQSVRAEDDSSKQLP